MCRLERGKRRSKGGRGGFEAAYEGRKRGERYEREADEIRHLLVGLHPSGGEAVARRRGGRGFLVVLGPGHERN